MYNRGGVWACLYALQFTSARAREVARAKKKDGIEDEAAVTDILPTLLACFGR